MNPWAAAWLELRRLAHLVADLADRIDRLERLLNPPDLED